ncbi:MULTISPECIES: pseudaminic acid synthase [Actinokineospora]|uniref:Pseudaminic acid synthase n=1 Tax=Actinokineospora fastidiosa TaxID=1816 RepID=A0A918L7G3_9PSEU|nr:MULTISPECIES: pseudaminic acid synthase [Actinokineospora]UVS76485.1 Pseudaminic acid synthase [Actinokineospora sp. UTMC 2448]GGS17796.1 pseudaminic acid synthase [Actinokineospora fastidiosa]
MSVRIGGHRVGPGHRPFVVAEMSGNHNGSLERALAIVDAVADSGAQALKLQTYTADTITIDVDRPEFRVSDGHALWGGETLYSLYRRAHTPWEWHGPLFARARSRGLTVFSSPFDPTAVELLESLDAPAYKIASSELVDLPLIELCARTGKPLIISTGMGTLAEVSAAVETARAAGNDQIVVLGCTAAYPADPSETDLRGLPLLAATGALVGLSDHTPGIGVPLAAVALGACLIEKHVTLSRADGGVDSAFSLEPAELAALVVESERAWSALGEGRVGPRPSEREGLRFRRSLYVVADVRAGEAVSRDNVRSIRPAGGLPPAALETVLGRAFRADVARGTPLSWDLV